MQGLSVWSWCLNYTGDLFYMFKDLYFLSEKEGAQLSPMDNIGALKNNKNDPEIFYNLAGITIIFEAIQT